MALKGVTLQAYRPKMVTCQNRGTREYETQGQKFQDQR